MQLVWLLGYKIDPDRRTQSRRRQRLELRSEHPNELEVLEHQVRPGPGVRRSRLDGG